MAPCRASQDNRLPFQKATQFLAAHHCQAALSLNKWETVFFIPPPPSERTTMVSLPPIFIFSSRQKAALQFFLYRGLEIALSSEPAKVALSIEFYLPLHHPFLSWNEDFLHPPSPHACALEGPASLPPEFYGWGLRRRTPT